MREELKREVASFITEFETVPTLAAVLVGDDPESFADSLVRLYHDEVLWNRLTNNGLRNIEKHFSPAKATAALQCMLGLGKQPVGKLDRQFTRSTTA